LIAGGGIAALVVIQLVPVTRTNPPVTREVTWNSAATRELAARACLDCHSNETTWPWQAYVAPASWLLTHDVNEGRETVNFSAWDQPIADADEIAEVVEEGEMPPAIYTVMHPEARLTAAERRALVTGLEETLRLDPPTAAEGHSTAETLRALAP
jgi:hypothetical protein